MVQLNWAQVETGLFMNIKAIFKKRCLWTIALYKIKDESQIFNLSSLSPFRFIGETGLRRNKEYHHTTADPFLFVQNERLYLFYETQTDFGVGQIYAQSMDIHGAWVDHGQVLKEDFHLSYPQVFAHNGQVWMIPEAASSGKVWLYAAELFPNNWRRVKVLIDEPLVDPSVVIKLEGIYLFGTTRTYELKLFFASDFNQEFVLIDCGISNDKFIARNAGRPIYIENVLYRVAQNCKLKYGENISLLRIDQLSIDGYCEQIITPDLYQTKPKWMEEGYHHISTALLGDEHFVAVDGMRRDKYLNTLLLAYFKVFE